MTTELTEHELEKMLKEAAGAFEPPAGLQDEIQRALTKENKMIDNGNSNHAGRRMAMPARIRIFKPALVAAAVLLACLAGGAFFWMSGAKSSVAFADVVRALTDTRTATFKLTLIPGKGMPAMQSDGIYADPGRMCMVSTQGTVILDTQQGKMTSIFPSLKRAMVITSKNMPPDAESPNFFETLRTRLQKAETEGGKNVTALGRKEINDRGVVGYRVKIADDNVITIWADVETKLPVTLEVALGSVVNTMTDIVLGTTVDEKLFDPQIPKDYTVQEMVNDMSPPTEADMIDFLKTWASHCGGKFPDKIRMSMFEDFSKAQHQAFKDRGHEPTMDEIASLQKLMLPMTRGLRFYMELPKGAAKHYAGKGVMINTPDTPIFWYRPEKSETYRVIYADLTVKETSTPPAAPGKAATTEPKPE